MNSSIQTMLMKLSSRKLWGSILGVIVGAYIVFALGEVEAGVTLIIASICGYNIAEAYVDGKSAASTVTNITATSTSKELVESLLANEGK